MKSFAMLAFGLMFAVSTAFGSDHLNQIADQAKKLESDFKKMNATLKAKNPDLNQIRTDLATVDADIDRLKEITADFEAAHPGMQAAAEKEWAKVKSIIQVIDVIHAEKARLANDESAMRNVRLLRAHAEGLAKRAAVLQETANRVAKALPPTSQS